MDDDIAAKTFVEKLRAHADEIATLTASGSSTTVAAEKIKAEIESKANDMRSTLAERRADIAEQRQRRVAAAKARIESARANAGAAEISFQARLDELNHAAEPAATEGETASTKPVREPLQNWSEFLSTSQSFAQPSSPPAQPPPAPSDLPDAGKKPADGASWSNFIEL